jgi:integrase
VASFCTRCRAKADAERWLTLTEAEVVRGEWLNPDHGRVPFATYAEAWVAERPNLRPTKQLYEGLVRLHLSPVLGTFTVQEITEPHVRRWRKTLLDSGVGEVTVAKAYRLLKAILSTAVDDGMIRRNPWRIKGASQEKSPERPVLTIRQVSDLADTVDARYRLLILLAVFCSLRWGELAALRLRHIDLTRATVLIEASVVELIDGSRITGPPKSDAGKRLISIPPFLLPEVAAHIENYTQHRQDDLLFVGPKNGPLRRPNFTRTWRRATEKAGLSGVHFHDLRHTGKPHRRRDRSQPAGTDGPHGPQHHPRRLDLPAPHLRAGPSHRRSR